MIEFMFKIVKKINKRIRDQKKLKAFESDFRAFESLSKRDDMPVNWVNRSPKLHDRSNDTPFDAHYIYHPAWAARVVNDIQPTLHIDFSSTLHFSTILSAFVPTHFYDYRPADLHLTGLESRSADLTRLAFDDNSIACLSCLHTIEHIGLGRYGDPIDPYSDLKAIEELQRVASDHLIIVVPVGKQRVVFNAHRVYDPIAFTEIFKDCHLESFSYVDDYGNFHMPAAISDAVDQNYACGCFHFRKIKVQVVTKS
jgi:hypothetical protein